MITFTVPCIPVAQPRQRTRVVQTNGRTFAQNYTPKKHPVNAFKAAAQHAAAGAYHGPPLEGALSLAVVFVMPRPKGMLWKTKPMPREPYMVSRNDWDNLGKALSDSLNGLLWRDDGQLSRVVVERWIAAGDEQPHVVVTVDSHQQTKDTA